MCCRHERAITQVTFKKTQSSLKESRCIQVERNQVAFKLKGIKLKAIKFVRKVSRIEPVSVMQCLDQDESSVYARPFDRMPVGYTLGYSLGGVAE